MANPTQSPDSSRSAGRRRSRSQPTLRLRFHRNAEGLAIELIGDLDSASSPLLLGVLHDLLADESRIDLDLVAVRRVTDGGCRSLVTLANRATWFGATVTISAASPAALERLAMAGVLSQFGLGPGSA